MNQSNLDQLIQALLSFRVSEKFVQGTLFMLAGVLMRTDSTTPTQQAQKALQWLFPHDIDNVADDIMGRMYDLQITQVFEEFFYRLDIDIPVREIRYKNAVTYLIEPNNHDLLPTIDLAAGDLSEVSNLYFAAAEQIGRRLSPSEYSHAEAYLAGICFFSGWASVDNKATVSILHSLAAIAPPVLKFFFALPSIPGAQPSGWLPTQIALWGIVSGLDETFMKVAWPYQSRVLFRDGHPIPGVEEITPSAFFSHCFEISHQFFDRNQSQIRNIARLGVGPDDVPAWSGSGMERPELFRVIENRWGYDPLDEALSEIELKQVNACIIFVLFCSLCRAASLN